MDNLPSMRRRVKQLYDLRSEIDAELARHDAAFEAQRLAREASLRPLLDKREALDDEMNGTLGDYTWIEGQFDEDGLPVVRIETYPTESALRGAKLLDELYGKPKK